MTPPVGRRAPRELYGTVNAVAADRVATEIPLTTAPRAGRGFYACVGCASSDALHRVPAGGFKCHSCGTFFTNVDLAAAGWGVEPGEACVALAGRLGIPIPDTASGPGRTYARRPLGLRRARPPAVHRNTAPKTVARRPSAHPGREKSGEPGSAHKAPGLAALRADGCTPSDAAAVYAAVLESLTLTPRGADYLTARGLPAAAAALYGFRSIDGRATWDALDVELRDSFVVDELVAAGLAWGDGEEGHPFGGSRHPWGGYRPAIVIPYRTSTGVAALRFRNIDPAAGKNDRYRTLGGTDPDIPFNEGALEGVAGEELHVVEGEFNALTFGLYGLRTIGIPGAQRWQPAWTPLLAPAARVVLWFDNDPPKVKPGGATEPGAGDQARRRFAKELIEHYGRTWVQAHVRAPMFPRGVDGQKRDANDLHVSGELRGYLDAAAWRT